MSGGSNIVAVTGVSGFVGSAVARALAARGATVRGIVRASSPRANLADFPGTLVEADLRDEPAMARALDGVAQLYHVAADYRLWARRPQDILDNNLIMTRVVMRAALNAKVGRVVYTSSVATLLPLDGAPSDETHAATPEQAVGIYKRAKVEAERMVEGMVGVDGLPAVIVNPSTPIGPRDVKPTPTGRIIVEAAKGRMPAYVDSGLNLVHVDDVAQGHLLAMERGQAGQRYVLGGEDVTLGAMLGEIARAVGRKPPRVALPRGPLFPLAYANEALARMTGKEPFLTVDSLRMAAHHMYYSSARAEAELGYRARPWQAAIGDALAWFGEQGMLA